MKTSQTIAVIGAALLMFAGASAQAQVITWGAATTISTDTDVSTTGTLLYADYVGGPATDAINGVTFTSVGSPTTAGFTDFDAAANYGPGVFNPVSGENGYSGSANYTTFLEGAYYNSGGTTGDQALTLSGLTSGQKYEVELWSQDGRGGRTTFGTTLTAGNSVTLVPSNVENANPGVGEYVIGTFTATGATETIDLSSSVGPPQINAFEVRDIPAAVPEPSTYALMGLGALALLVISRRRCKA